MEGKRRFSPGTERVGDEGDDRAGGYTLGIESRKMKASSAMSSPKSFVIDISGQETPDLVRLSKRQLG